jgi:dTDP-4-dehydrorhamnose reductase
MAPGGLYSKDAVRDAEDEYGKSKAAIAERIEKEFRNTKMLRVSIIGHERTSSVALLDWFLASEGEVKGYTNHYWNGITTLEWAKLACELAEEWDSFPILNQHASPEVMSKYDLLVLVREVYGKDIVITPFEAATAANKCLKGDRELPSLKGQLTELRAFYGK